MKKIKWIIILALITNLITCNMVTAINEEQTDQIRADQPEQKVIKHIIMITLDEIYDKQMISAHTPNINGLAARGIRTSAINVLPANYPAFIASLLTGCDPNIHGFFASGQQIKAAVLPEIACQYGRTAVFISGSNSVPKGLFTGQGENKVMNYQVLNNTDKIIMDKAIKIFSEKRPYFVGIRLAISGRQMSSDDKARAINQADAEIGRFLNVLNSYGVENESLIIVAGNYSIHPDLSNLSKDNNELMIPTIMAGPGLKTGTTIPPVRIVDIAPTIALLSGMQISPKSNGNILWNALKSGTGFMEENLLLKRIKDLSEDYSRAIGLINRLEEEKRLVRVEKEHVNEEKLKIQKTIEGRDKQIKELKWKISLLKLLGVLLISMCGAGYLAEYLYLKKKFLMF